jgi:predicted dehydrogenase
MNKIPCAIVGIGGIGAMHAQWLADTGRIEILAVCDANESMRARAAEKIPGARFHTDLGSMLASENIRLAVIASPHHLHAPMTVQCLNAGVNVLVEKPMAITYAQCRQMIDAAQDAGCFLTVFHNRRMDSWFLKAREIIQSGALGELIEIQAAIHNNPAFKNSRTWRSFKASSGGILYDWGAHLMDQILHFAAAQPETIAARFHRIPGADPLMNDDHATVELRFPSGCIGRLVISDTARHPAQRYVITGSRATLVDEWNWNSNSLKVYAQGTDGQIAVEEHTYQAEGVHRPRFFDNLADHLEGKAPLLVEPESAARIIRLLELAGISAARHGEPIPVPA